MGWSISHGNSPRGTNYRSAGAMCEVGQQVAHVVSGSDWRAVRKLFKLANSGDGPFTISHGDAGRMALVLRKAAGHPKMPVSFREPIREVADAAQRAAAARQPWEWS